MLKTRMYAIAVVILILTLSACSADSAQAAVSSISQVSEAGISSAGEGSDAVEPGEVDVDDVDLDVILDPSVTTIHFAEDGVQADGSGVAVDGNVATITAGGDYLLQGSLSDGQILVDVNDDATVHLFLNGLDLTSATSAPVYVRNAEKVVVTLVEGTLNVLTDAAVYLYESPEADEPNAALFSNDDLTINGTGSLVVHAQYAHGIASDDDLLIVSGTITVNAVKDGVKGRDSLVILDGDICVVAGSDGLQSHNDSDPEKGNITIEGGVLDITAGMDGIQAEATLSILGGEIQIVAGGGSAAVAAEAESAKGLKAGVALVVADGVVQIDARDDALHANEEILIGGGQFSLASGDDGIHADVRIVIDGGDIAIVQSYEGIESAAIVINDGMIDIIASDDGINASTGGGQGMMGGGMAIDSTLEIHGATITIVSGGDGLDANGNGFMTGGVVFVSGPNFTGNSALDFNGEILVSGGYLVAAGSLGMAEAPGTASSQYSVMVNFPVILAEGTPFQLEHADGTVIAAVVPANAYQSVVVSSPELQAGETYRVSVGGTLTESNLVEFIIYGRYTEGTEFATFTIADSVTIVGEAVSGGMSGGGTRGRR